MKGKERNGEKKMVKEVDNVRGDREGKGLNGWKEVEGKGRK